MEPLTEAMFSDCGSFWTSSIQVCFVVVILSSNNITIVVGEPYAVCTDPDQAASTAQFDDVFIS